MGRGSMRSRQDLLLVATLSGPALVMMSGCTPPAEAPAAPSQSSKSPTWHVGDCYAYTSAQARGFEDATDPVPCAQEHTGETVFVTPLGQPDQVEVERFWQAAVPGNGLLMFYPLLDNSPLAARCADPAREYLGLDAGQIPARFEVRYFVPSQSEWDRGDRSMRCDVVSQTLEVTDVGFEEQLRALPVTVAGITDKTLASDWVQCATFDDEGTQRNLQQVGTCASTALTYVRLARFAPSKQSTAAAQCERIAEAYTESDDPDTEVVVFDEDVWESGGEPPVDCYLRTADWNNETG